MNKNLVAEGQVTFGKTARDYALHRPGFPESFFNRLADKDVVQKGYKTLDIGAGTGTIARGFAKLGCRSFGLDPSTELLSAAYSIAAESGLEVEFKEGVAEQLPFPDNSFDVVAAGQCWHWFDPDKAAKEIARVLNSDGTLIIANFDWQPVAGNVVARTLELIPQYNPEWTPETKPDFFRLEPDRIPTPAGFKKIEIDNYIEPTTFTHESWRGRVRASAPIGASTLSDDGIKAFDRALKKLLANEFPEETLAIPHFVTTRIYEKTIRAN